MINLLKRVFFLVITSNDFYSRELDKDSDVNGANEKLEGFIS